jgi:hypothetical protein
VGGWCLVWLLGGSSPGKRNVPVRRGRDAVAMAALLSASVLAVLVNPYGLGLPRAWLRTLSIPLPSLIQEHGPLDLADPLSWMTVVLGAGYLVALVGLWPKRPRVSWLLPLVWFVLAYQRVRNAPLFAILGVLAAAEVLPATRWAAWLNRREMLLVARPDEPLGGPGRRWHAAWLPLVLVLAVMWIQATGVCAPLVGPDWAGPDASRFPNELLPELERINRSCPQNTRIFNDMNFGGFLIFHAPRLRVFIDDRCALYGGEFLEAYDRARREDTAQLDRWRRQYGFRYALVETGINFDRRLEDSEGWTRLRRTPAATLYRRD